MPGSGAHVVGLGLSQLAQWVNSPASSDNKYSRGVLGVRTGSTRYPGAAVLSTEAAWRTGVGMVYFVPAIADEHARFGVPSPAAAVLAVRPETILGVPRAASHPCDAWVIGSGTEPSARSPEETVELENLLTGPAPVVVDAGALSLAATMAQRTELACPAILTPHRGEFARLWRQVFDEPMPNDDAEATTSLARALGVTVLLKGSTTTLASSGGRLAQVHGSTPWLATAGTGDVLAGILGALGARHARAVQQDPEVLVELGATAVLLHDASARWAAGSPEGPMTALDVAHAVPHAHAHFAPSST